MPEGVQEVTYEQLINMIKSLSKASLKSIVVSHKDNAVYTEVFGEDPIVEVVATEQIITCTITRAISKSEKKKIAAQVRAAIAEYEDNIAQMKRELKILEAEEDG